MANFLANEKSHCYGIKEQTGGVFRLGKVKIRLDRIG